MKMKKGSIKGAQFPAKLLATLLLKEAHDKTICKASCKVPYATPSKPLISKTLLKMLPSSF